MKNLKLNKATILFEVDGVKHQMKIMHNLSEKSINSFPDWINAVTCRNSRKWNPYKKKLEARIKWQSSEELNRKLCQEYEEFVSDNPAFVINRAMFEEFVSLGDIILQDDGTYNMDDELVTFHEPEVESDDDDGEFFEPPIYSPWVRGL